MLSCLTYCRKSLYSTVTRQADKPPVHLSKGIPMSKFIRLPLIALILAALTLTAAAEENIHESGITLTQEEKNWLAAHPSIRAGAEMDWPPFDFVENDNVVGFSNDYLRLLSKKAGFKIEFVYGVPWDKIVEMIRICDIDVIPGIWMSEERKSFLRFSRPYYTDSNTMVVRRQFEDISSLKKLSGKTMAAVNGSSITTWIAQHYSQINLIMFDSSLDAIKAVSDGRAEAFVDQRAVLNYILHTGSFENVMVYDIPGDETLKAGESLHVGIRKDWPVFAGIVKKAMDAVTESEFRQLEQTWLYLEK